MADLGTDHTCNSFHYVDGIHFPISDYWLTMQICQLYHMEGSSDINYLKKLLQLIIYTAPISCNITHSCKIIRHGNYICMCNI